jgi:hypothetical protein
MNDRLIAGLAEVALQQQALPPSESALQSAREAMTAALLQGCKARAAVVSEANTLSELSYQKDALFRNNQVSGTTLHITLHNII